MSLSRLAPLGSRSQVAAIVSRFFQSLKRRRLLVIFLSALVTFILFGRLFPVSKSVAQSSSPRNAIIFVADGLRPSSVNATDTPALYGVGQQGVSFPNSHALFPTFTTANGAVIATGHYLGDNGDFSNTIYAGFPVPNAGNSVTPFLENDAVLADMNDHFSGNYLNEESLLAAARAAGFSTAAVGKVGPALIQDVTQGNRSNGVVPPPTTIVIDDSTGKTGGVPLNSDITTYLTAAILPTTAPDRSNGAPSTSQQSNGFSGSNTTPGTTAANLTQQQYFVDSLTKAILPLFQSRNKPFVAVYWSRDPDGTQHNQGDSLNSLTPGINGPTSKAAVKNADNNLNQILTTLKNLGLDTTTDVFVTADHGFNTISKQSATSYAASLTYPSVNQGFLPVGFLAIDIAKGLGLPLYDPDQKNQLVTPGSGTIPRPASGDGLIGNDPNNPDVVIAANGGSDLIYLPNASNRQALAPRIVNLLLQQDYVSGLFVDGALGSIPGTLPLSTINLQGSSLTPTPAITVNFRTFHIGCDNPLACSVEVADTGLQQGQGMHGTFSRADTFNYMAAVGPDFKQGFVDQAPVSNVDVPLTIAKILGLNPPPDKQGTLVGRAISEALAGGPNTVASTSTTLSSFPAANGLRTILKYQTVGSAKYFDVAGFPGRSTGL
ncbi:MAG: alkaline phosphatase family protein [Chroococcidiopsidaceae cyanobacterium CP_BM_ER_R8_30]|nr:alkaline phosphatase family protein [Chroococcidiopsidaceae cyanobacterium CP_BM_ER_R8_30]